MLAVIGLLAWFLIVAPVTFSQTVFMPLGDALVEPSSGTTIMPLQGSKNMGVIMDDRGIEPFAVITPPTVQRFDPTPLPTLPTLEPLAPSRSLDAPSLSAPSYDAGYGLSGYGRDGY